MTDAKKPAGTTMEGMVWNANHVLDMASSPRTKKDRDILKDVVAVAILDIADIGLVLVGSRGSGVLMVKHEDEWSPPFAITITSHRIGCTLGVDHKGIMIVFVANSMVGGKTLDHIVHGLSTQGGIGFSRPRGELVVGGTGIQEHVRTDKGAKNAYITTNGEDHCFVYTYTDPPQFSGRSLEGVTIRYHGKANERFYGKAVSPQDIVRWGYVTIPEGSGIPDLHKKLKALETGTDITPTPEDKRVKHVRFKLAVEASDVAKADMPDEIEEFTV